MIETPHFRQPFQRGSDGKVICVEQNSPEHVRSCELTIAMCPRGFRLEYPEFGWPWPRLKGIPVDPQPLLDALDRFEPRVIGRTAREYADLIDVAHRYVEVFSPMGTAGVGDDVEPPQVAAIPGVPGGSTGGGPPPPPPPPPPSAGGLYPSPDLYPSPTLYPQPPGG